ncbi:transposase [Burkholderia stabilis]|uniref:Transposase n=1 Tax=Burkholderia stabilis TaxID=95485 RepID=A0A4Q2A5I0_9BURK|nr:helix-turn-helix domain-containing protein [Burkholderia stabilis]RXV64562.1 transposase [Burkholderia stabilis]
MQYYLNLSGVERETLLNLSANHMHRDIRVRATGILLIDSGLTAPKAAAQLKVSSQSVYNWIHAWQEDGLSALLRGHHGGRSKLLTDAFVSTALEIAKSGSLSLKEISRMLESHYGHPLPCTLQALGAALRRKGWSFRRNNSHIDSQQASALIAERFAVKRNLLLTEVEKETLLNLESNHRHRDIRLRATGILLVNSGLAVRRVAARINVSPQTVYHWIHAWREEGICALLGGHNRGRPRLLSEALVVAAVEIAQAEPFTLKQIGCLLEARYGQPLPCSLESLGAALRRKGCTLRRNKGRNRFQPVAIASDFESSPH